MRSSRRGTLPAAPARRAHVPRVTALIGSRHPRRRVTAPDGARSQDQASGPVLLLAHGATRRSARRPPADFTSRRARRASARATDQMISPPRAWVSTPTLLICHQFERRPPRIAAEALACRYESGRASARRRSFSGRAAVVDRHRRAPGGANDENPRRRSRIRRPAGRSRGSLAASLQPRRSSFPRLQHRG